MLAKMVLMNWNEYFDDELKATTAHAVLGAAAGYVSFVANATNMGLLFAVIALAVGYAFSTQVLKQQTKKWYGSAFVLLLSWLIVWTLFYNVAIR